MAGQISLDRLLRKSRENTARGGVLALWLAHGEAGLYPEFLVARVLAPDQLRSGLPVEYRAELNPHDLISLAREAGIEHSDCTKIFGAGSKEAIFALWRHGLNGRRFIAYEESRARKGEAMVIRYKGRTQAATGGKWELTLPDSALRQALHGARLLAEDPGQAQLIHAMRLREEALRDPV